MLPHQNNGTLPEAHIAQREAGRQQRQSDARLIATPLPPLDQSLSAFRHWPLITAVGLLVIGILALFHYVPGVGASERPLSTTKAVEIVQVDSDLGRYQATLADGRIVVVTAPAATRTRPSRPLTIGAATLISSAQQRVLVQGGVRYRIVQLAVAR